MDEFIPMMDMLDTPPGPLPPNLFTLILFTLLMWISLDNDNFVLQKCRTNAKLTRVVRGCARGRRAKQ